MLSEVLIFVPSVANFRVTWLVDRLRSAQLASLAAEAGGGTVPEALRMELLKSAQVKAVSIKRDGMRRLVLPPDHDLSVDAHYDVSMDMPNGEFGDVAHRIGLVGDALSVFLAGGNRMLRVTGHFTGTRTDNVEIVLPEAPLRTAMLNYGLNVLGLSIIISIITAALVYFALNRLLVRPMMRISANMQHFSRNPEDVSRIIEPTARQDEIGTAERELAHMQGELAQLLLQKNRLAQLGLAVSKINHDLRNMLASAQLISDRLTGLPDPTVQRFAPKLIASLDRAIAFCNDTLRFGRAEEAKPRRELLRLKPLVEEIGDALALPREDAIDWIVELDDNLRIDVDRDHLFRVLSNLVRNAVQVLEAQPAATPATGTPSSSAGSGGHREAIRVAARRDGRTVVIDVADTGPGVPAKVRPHLFQAFQSSARKGGTGLGLAIAAELIAAHGGRLTLRESARGATFRIEIPDRSP
jgi:signal transduction histidine kinase